MELIVITPEQDKADETLVVNALFERGMQRLHLRKPAYAIDDYRNFIKKIDPRYHSRIVLNGCFELLSEFDLGGLHLNSAARDQKDAGRLVAGFSPSFISTSFHSWREVRENEFPYGYVFISPVFNSISKKGYLAEIDLREAKEVKTERKRDALYCPKIFGLGGVDAQNIPVLNAHRFDGAAVLGSVWQSGDPVANFTTILEVTTRLADR